MTTTVGGKPMNEEATVKAMRKAYHENDHCPLTVQHQHDRPSNACCPNGS